MKTVEQLKSENLPHCRASDFAKMNEDTPEAVAAFNALDHYLSHFLPKCDKCPKCGATLQHGGEAGWVMDAFLSTFKWGLAHGEGFCSAADCGYPIRLYHFPPKEVGVERFVAMLCYHPDELKPRPA